MDSVLSILLGVIAFATFLLLVAYVTWLFCVRLRAKESPPKTFLRWLERPLRPCSRALALQATDSCLGLKSLPADLRTEAGPNNSFKPNPLRGSA
jgi:hypothetical protein